MNYAKVYKNGTSNVRKFRHFSQWIVDNHVEGIPGNGHLNKVDLRNIADALSLDMAIGSELFKRKYIVTGIVIGGALALTISKVIDIYQKRESLGFFLFFIFKKIKEEYTCHRENQS